MTCSSRLQGRSGRCCLVPRGLTEANINQDVALIRLGRKEANPWFLLAALRGPAVRAQIDLISQGGTRNHLNLKQTGDLRVWLPPLVEQRKIAAILSSVDDAIEKTQAVIDQVQVVKQGLMQELLTRGLPGRHTRFKQTEIGEVPEEWDVSPAAAVCERIVVGIVIKPAQHYVHSGVPCLRSLNVREDRIEYSNMKYISADANELLRKSQLRIGDVLTVRTGYPGTSAVVPPDLEGANCIDLIISTPRPRLRGRFLSRFVNSERGQAAIAEGKGGLAQQHFNIGAMKTMLVTVPSLTEQDDICNVLDEVDRTIQRNRAFIEQLDCLKAGLMSVLLTGEVRVTPDADAA